MSLKMPESGSPASRRLNVSSLMGSASDRANEQDNINYETLEKHLVNPKNALKQQGGDITRQIYQRVDNHSDLRMRRSSSFSEFLDGTRRGSTASEMMQPGGFRREFLINKSKAENKAPPNFVSRNFMEFLSIYGHFAGEDFDDSDEGDELTVLDEESPLLEHEIPRRKSKPKPKGEASVFKTFLLLFKALVGSGVLFLPRAFYNGGMVFLTITLATFGLLTFFCYLILIDSKTSFKKSSYGELGFVSFGKPLKVCILVSILLSQIGFVTTYILFTAENMKSFIASLGIDSVTMLTIVCIECVLLIPLAFFRNLTSLSLISLVSSVFVFFGLVIIFYYCAEGLAANGWGPDIVGFNANTWSLLVGVAVTAYEGVGLILPIESSMAEPEKFPKVLAVAIFIITTIFVAIGVVGYSAFGSEVKSIVILNLPQDLWAVQSISLLYSLAVFLSAPLQLLPALRIGELTLFNSGIFIKGTKKDEDGRLYRASGKYNSHIKWLKNLNRAIWVAIICFIAYKNASNIDRFISFNGCFACIPLVYIYPPLIHLKTFGTELSLKQKIYRVLDWLLIAIGTVTVVYSTYQILFLN